MTWACYGVLRFIMESAAKGCEVSLSQNTLWIVCDLQIYTILTSLDGCNLELIILLVQPTEIAAIIFGLLLVGSSGHNVQSQ
ncbi:putative DNA-(apurinic or apyrimidinic site) lyase [Dioscorea sansibarensis]